MVFSVAIKFTDKLKRIIKIDLTNSFLSILGITCIIMIVLSSFLILVGLVCSFQMKSENWFEPQNVINFLEPHSKFYSIYGGCSANIVAYVALKQYALTNTNSIIDLYTEKVSMKIHKFIGDLRKDEVNGLLLIASSNLSTRKDNIKFTGDELYNNNPELVEALNNLYIDKGKSWYKDCAFEALGLLEAFASKVVNGLVDNQILRNTCGLAFISQVIVLYPIISVFRVEGKQEFYKNIVILYNQWRAKIVI